jgi:hypothetical protein
MRPVSSLILDSTDWVAYGVGSGKRTVVFDGDAPKIDVFVHQAQFAPCREMCKIQARTHQESESIGNFSAKRGEHPSAAIVDYFVKKFTALCEVAG